MIHIADSQTDRILDFIQEEEFWDDKHYKSLKDTLETFNFVTFADREFSEHLAKRKRIIIPDEDGKFIEFIIQNTMKYRGQQGGLFVEVYTSASYIELKKSKVIKPQKVEGYTASQHADFALAGTEWEVGRVDYAGIRTITIESHTNPYAHLKRIASEFGLELRFRIEVDGNKVTHRYVDLLEHVGGWQGREVEFGKDLLGIERKEDTSRIVTALIGLGPEREDGTRLEVLVEDKEALARWGRNGQHLIETYEPESTDQNMTEERLRELTKNELEKRINSIVEYTADIADLEKVPGLEHEKIRFGDTIRIKDTAFTPSLYLEARVHTQERSIKKNGYKTVTLGDYIEYTEEEVMAIWKALQAQIQERLARLVTVSIDASAGTVFKNGVGSTILRAVTYRTGQEIDLDGQIYTYEWQKYDKDGNLSGTATGKQISVQASEINEKATFNVTVKDNGNALSSATVTVTNVYDGEDGEQGPPGPQGQKGEDGKTFYTWIKYADTPTSGMSDSPDGKEYIGIAYNKETPTPSTNYADYVWSKFKGEQGVPGPPGEDGQPTYTWVKYADDDKGNGMSDSPDGKLYIGLAFNKTTPEESNNPADYTWSLMPQNIEIGGRNLNRNSNDFSESVWISYDGGVIRVTENVIVDEWGATDATQVRISEGNRTSILKGYKTITNDTDTVEGETYTVSLYVKNLREYQMSVNVNGLDPRPTVYLEPYEAKRIVVTGKRSSSGLQLQFRSHHANYYTEFIVWRAQVEKGHKATDWTPAPEDVQEEIDAAKQEAEEAKQTAQQAQTTADGKNSVFTQSTAPPTDGRKIGDVWFDTSRDNLMHRFNGQQWVEAKWGEQSIVANSITANHIKSLVGLNVNDQFVVDSQGNVKFAGNLEGASGTFSGDIEVQKIKDEQVFSNVFNGDEFRFVKFKKGITNPDTKNIDVSQVENMAKIFYNGVAFANSSQTMGIGMDGIAHSDTLNVYADWIIISAVSSVDITSPVNILENTDILESLTVRGVINAHNDLIIRNSSVLKTDRNWIAPTLLNGVSNYGGSYERAGYYKDAQGFVHLRGFLTGSGDGKHLFTLPDGYRPSRERAFATYSNSSLGSSRVQIYPDGRVLAVISGNWLFLDGILFDT